MADDRIFSVEIITPDRIFYQGEAEMIEFTTVNGEIGVYKNHIPLTTVLAPGIVTITGPEGKKEAAVHSGFAEILQQRSQSGRMRLTWLVPRRQKSVPRSGWLPIRKK